MYGRWSSYALKKFKHLSPPTTWVCQNLTWLNAALPWQIDLNWKKFWDKCLHHQHLFLSSHKYRISHFFFSFSCSSLFHCPVLVTGAVEGSQSVKEARRGLMRTVLPKRVSSLGLFLLHLRACVCVCVYIYECMIAKISLCSCLQV